MPKMSALTGIAADNTTQPRHAASTRYQSTLQQLAAQGLVEIAGHAPPTGHDGAPSERLADHERGPPLAVPTRLTSPPP
jgi:hypothetical protein